MMGIWFWYGAGHVTELSSMSSLCHCAIERISHITSLTKIHFHINIHVRINSHVHVHVYSDTYIYVYIDIFTLTFDT